MKNKNNIKEITKKQFVSLSSEQIMDVLGTTLFDLFKAEKRIKRLKIWVWVLGGLLAIDAIFAIARLTV